MAILVGSATGAGNARQRLPCDQLAPARVARGGGRWNKFPFGGEKRYSGGMKIDSSGRVRAASVRAKNKTGKAKKTGDFSKHLDAREDATAPIASVGPTQSVDAVVALQGVGDAMSGGANARARQWGNDTLDQLERIQMDLLVGSIPKDRLIGLARMVSERREHAVDRRLNDLLDDIDLRVRVEIAKYEPRRSPVSL